MHLPLTEDNLFANLKLIERVYFKDFWDYKSRTVDRQLLDEVLSMRFMDIPHKNIIIWGLQAQERVGSTWFLQPTGAKCSRGLNSWNSEDS